jgi:hypothetical protein
VVFLGRVDTPVLTLGAAEPSPLHSGVLQQVVVTVVPKYVVVLGTQEVTHAFVVILACPAVATTIVMH